MNQVTLTKKTVDHSDTGHFSFSFFCDCCGKEWLSPRKPFSGGICNRVENDEAYRLLWGNEHRAAFNEANLEAHRQYNGCLSCGIRVCDDCFNLEKNICRDCDEKRT